MAFRNNAYIKVWGIGNDNAQGYPTLRVSTNYKNKAGDYVQDFGGFVTLKGNAAEYAREQGIDEGETFKIVSCSVTNKYNADTKTTSYFFDIWEIEPANSEASSSKSTKKTTTRSEETSGTKNSKVAKGKASKTPEPPFIEEPDLGFFDDGDDLPF